MSAARQIFTQRRLLPVAPLNARCILSERMTVTIGAMSFFGGLPEHESVALRRLGRKRHWRRGAVLFLEGEISGWVAVVLAGVVKLSAVSDGGRETVLGMRGPGALVGEIEAVDRKPRPATARVLAPLDALVVPADDFMAFLRESQTASLILARELCGQLRDADRKRAEYHIFDTTERLVCRLLEMADRFGQPVDGGVRIWLTHDELAGWAGASREAIDRALQTLRHRGWIETGRGSIVLHDVLALRRKADHA